MPRRPRYGGYTRIPKGSWYLVHDTRDKDYALFRKESDSRGDGDAYRVSWGGRVEDGRNVEGNWANTAEGKRGRFKFCRVSDDKAAALIAYLSLLNPAPHVYYDYIKSTLKKGYDQ